MSTTIWKNEQLVQDTFAVASKFGCLYAHLDVIRTMARDAGVIAGSILEQKDIDRLNDLAGQTNVLIGIVLDASKRNAHRAKEIVAENHAG